MQLNRLIIIFEYTLNKYYDVFEYLSKYTVHTHTQYASFFLVPMYGLYRCKKFKKLKLY
jgi:hypothetical protein